MESWKNELYHHGVLGMKWGVRRYQNYDGTYTARGVKRYKTSERKYDSAKTAQKESKERYKSNIKNASTKDEAASAKLEYSKEKRQNAKDVRSAKKQMKKDYRQLKKDNLADQGKELYSQGKTITTEKEKTNFAIGATMTVGSLAGSALWGSGLKYVTNRGTIEVGRLAATAVYIGSRAASAVMSSKQQMNAKKLRAYYAHNRGVAPV